MQPRRVYHRKLRLGFLTKKEFTAKAQSTQGNSGDMSTLRPSSPRVESSLIVSTPLDDDTKKPKESLGFVSICRLLADAGFCLRMGEEGLEPPTSTL